MGIPDSMLQLPLFQDTTIPSNHCFSTPPNDGNYGRGCRCQGCKAAHNAYQKAFHKRKMAESEAYRTRYRQYKAKHARKVKADPGRRAEINKRSRNYQQQNRDRLAEFKMEKGCVDCGYNAHAAALDFDHVSGQKLRDISKMANFKMERILIEIAQCEVVCANCHRIRTFERHKKSIGAKVD